MWPLIRLLPQKTNFTYVKFAGLMAFLSITAVLATFASIATGGFRANPVAMYQEAQGTPLQKAQFILSHGFNLGIDFQGGTLLEIEAPRPLDLQQLREGVGSLNLGDVQVQGFSDPNRAMVRFQAPQGRNPEQVLNQVRAELSSLAAGVRFTRTEEVGAKVSGELFLSGLAALGLAILLMLIYIWFRFEWQFGLGAVLGLFHDVILTLGIFSFFRIEFTLTIIAALLTIIGYGINDTVVVFDRIRENLRKYKRMPLSDIIDLSLNETLSRTIITGVTALMALVGLYFFGGESLSGFAIAMIFGIVTGTYSSLYVAAPAILIWGVKRGEGDPARGAGREAADASV
ncbi:MAG: protein translocase subunit SecF [Hyphomonadaceae bacterium]|nr:protein translocase subunit SecF [Hyphomonadaceae bacterium]